MSDHPEDFIQFNTDHNTLIENVFKEYAPQNWDLCFCICVYGGVLNPYLNLLVQYIYEL